MPPLDATAVTGLKAEYAKLKPKLNGAFLIEREPGTRDKFREGGMT